VNEFTGALPGLFAPAVYSNGVLKNDGTSTGLPVNFSNAHRWYFGPDAGFAWDVRGDGKTSLRGGFGMSYTRIFTNQDCSFNCIANAPAFTSQNLSSLVLPTTTTWNVGGPGGAASAPGVVGNTLSVQTLTAADYNIQASPVASWSLGIQHEFPGNFTASIVGAGSRIQHMVGTWNWNQAPHYVSPAGVAYDYNPLISFDLANSSKGDNAAYYAPFQGYGNINVMSTQLHQEWNGLEVQVKHSMSKSLYLTAAYTWSHDTSNSVVDPYDLHRFHGNNGLNYPQSLAITLLYELPFYRNSHGVGNVILGGWRINDITTFRAGNSINPGISMPSGVGGLTNRPFVVPGVSTKGPKSWKKSQPVKAWFNQAAFVDPTLHINNDALQPLNATLYYGYYGNAQNGTIQGPGQEIWNMSLFKQFHFRTNVIEFRAEAFNTFNHTNPNNPNASIGGSSVNQITGASDPRILEMALRYKF
jgi:hypothetical protein